MHETSFLNIQEGNTSTIQGAGLIEDHPKYKLLDSTLREKESEIDKLTNYSLDLEGKLQKLL